MAQPWQEETEPKEQPHMPDDQTDPAPAKKGENLSTRGPLRYLVDTSSPQVTAGPPFSLYVTVTNPYDVLVRVHAIRAVIPIEFHEAKSGAPLRKRLFAAVRDVASVRSTGVIPRPDYLVATSAIPPSSENGGENPQYDLQPGNSMVQSFTLETNYSTFFPPAAYNLQFQVEYDIDGHANRDTIGYRLTVRSTLKTLIVGGMIGAAVGWMARQYGSGTASGKHTLDIITALLIAALLGGVAVVAFARKRDAQPFIAIEDFWGALFIGFVVGYSGSSTLDKLVESTTGSGVGGKPS
jgi:hypothetical protein